MMSHKNIKRLYSVIERSLFKQGSLSYARVLEALVRLCSEIKSTEKEETIWSIGECEGASLDALVVGAYWYCAEYHGGQWSPEYKALSALGDIYSPGMSAEMDTNSSEFVVYERLEAMR